MYQVLDCTRFFLSGFLSFLKCIRFQSIRYFKNVSGLRYQVGESIRLKVSRPDTFLQNLVKKNLCECRCGCGYVFQNSMEVAVCGKFSNRTLGSGTTPGKNVDSDIIP